MSASVDDIRAHFTSLERDRSNIENQIIDITYFMPGIMWETAWSLESSMREKILKYIQSRKREESGDDRQFM